MIKLSHRSQFKWGAICFLGALIALMFYRYDPHLWVQTVKLWNLFQDRHQLKVILRSYGAYSPLVFILLQMTQVVVAPLPGLGSGPHRVECYIEYTYTGETKKTNVVGTNFVVGR